MRAFDGASNVEKAGDVISIKFLRVQCIHGKAHAGSLFFENVFKLEKFNMLVMFCNSLRNYFGSSRHAPQQYSRSASRTTIIIFH